MFLREKYLMMRILRRILRKILRKIQEKMKLSILTIRSSSKDANLASVAQGQIVEHEGACAGPSFSHSHHLPSFHALCLGFYHIGFYHMHLILDPATHRYVTNISCSSSEHSS
ncbi:hypothetical protein PanWU01x14_108550 [Parasponia andersonii]|uniref:Uncharacterized protein n=1 Tax=Parasponia andersonii TaxID=3476 RepID=A0A2P5D001_PARAD|nr:hypothetical protein PanWU01x14_108550 [Parasponia andersonii]